VNDTEVSHGDIGCETRDVTIYGSVMEALVMEVVMVKDILKKTTMMKFPMRKVVINHSEWESTRIVQVGEAFE